MGTVSVMEAKSTADFDQILRDAGNQLVVAHFYAEWAPQCQQMNEVLQELSKQDKFKQCKFVKVEAESVPEVSQKYSIAAVPTCLLLKGTVEVDRVNGANVPDLTKKIETQSAPGATAAPQKPTEDLDVRLKRLINSAPVMLFMKGDAKEPRCGFSKQMVAILDAQGVKYSTFNILSDEEVRQGLKKFSNWPTYPQLYISGDLLGGIDIVKELVESGEFAEQLPKQQSLDDRLKGLVSQDKVMLFMKGCPSGPRCGFSKTVVALLNSTGVKYSTFDILEDEEVRQGLKKYSDWPTYPQIYVNGTLVGGLDILKELQETGELVSTLNGE